MQYENLQLKRTLRSLLLTLLLSVAGMTNAKAQSFTVGDLNYTINDDGASVTLTGHVDGISGQLVIPESVELYGATYPVTAIGNYAFQYCSGLIGDLSIPNTVTSIGHWAFAYCGFTGSLTIPENLVSMGYEVFDYCHFISLNYNAINCYIGGYWLYDCNYITTLTIGENVQVIPNYFLADCSITGELVIPNSVTSIGGYAFYNCTGFTGALIIPNSVTTIEYSAFYGCTGFSGSLSIPNSVTSIGNSAFSGCTGFTGSLTIGNSVTSIGENAFYGCSGFTGSLIIPNAVTNIGNSAFMNCNGFSGTLTHGPSLTEIGNSAFFGACENFTSFNVLAETPPSVGTNAFLSVNMEIPVYVSCGTLEAYQNASGWNDFTNLQEADPCQWVISATVHPTIGGTISGAGIYEQGQTCILSAIPNEGFEFLNWTENGMVVSTDETYSFTVTGNSNLVAHFHTLNPNIIAFADPNVENICLANWDTDGDGALSYEEAATVTDLGYAFNNNQNITSFDELQYFTGLTSIGYGAFYRCRNLTSIVIPDGVVSIGEEAFCICYNLLSANIPEGVVSIGDMAFYCCGLKGEITLPAPLESVGGHAFYGCDGITTVNYNATNCQMMGYGSQPVFYDCAFTHLNIGSNVQNIPNFAFKRCFMITDMTVAAVNPPTIYPGTFGMVSRSIPVYVPHSSGDAYSSAQYWEEFFNINEVYFNDVQVVPLAQGTNWFSTYIEITLEDLQNALVEALPNATTITIKGKTQSSFYNGTRWRGALGSLDLALMYQISVPESCEITLEGMPVDPAQHPVTINNGSNWIGFPFSESMTLDEAFSEFPVSGDKIQSKSDGQATYSNRWRGALNALVPGQGYIYQSNSAEDRVFTFPTGAK